MKKNTTRHVKPNKPNPQELDEILTEDNVADFKRYDCKTYEKCLDVAAYAGWPQFTCNDCKVYAPIPADDPSSQILIRLAKKLVRDDNL